VQIFRYLIIIFLITGPGQVFAQINLHRYTSETDTFYWKKYIHFAEPKKLSLKPFTVKRAKKITEQFLAENLALFPQFTSDSASRFGIDDLKKSLFPVDINGDQNPDVVFSGYSGGESDMVKIFVNQGGHFELVFEDYQYITRFDYVDGKLDRLQTADLGCCDAYLWFTRDYKILQEVPAPAFIKGKQTVIYKYTEEPRAFLPVPEPFRTRTDSLMVRASAARLNEPFNPHLDTFGNIVARYRAKASGVVLAIKNDDKGNAWCFVEIFPDTKPSASILYDTEKIPTFIRGWVSILGIELN